MYGWSFSDNLSSISSFFVFLVLVFFNVFTGNCVSQSIAPLDNKTHALEDETVTLSCRYEYSGNVRSLQWYRQYPGSRPEYLLMFISASKTVSHATPGSPRLNATENNKTVNLIISCAAVSDSALYYCAMEPTVTGNPATLYKNSLQDDALPFVLSFLSDSFPASRLFSKITSHSNTTTIFPSEPDCMYLRFNCRTVQIQHTCNDRSPPEEGSFKEGTAVWYQCEEAELSIQAKQP